MEFTPLQKKFVDAYKRTPLVKKFYLTGGTLLATRYLHHRHSLDLDFFNNARVILTEVQRAMDNIVDRTGIKLGEVRHIADRYEWEITDAREHTKVEFVWYDFKPLKPHPHWQGILIDTLEDIAANKVMALLERREPKDIFDIYYILQNKNWPLVKCLKLMEEKFGLKIDEQTFLADAELVLKRLDAVRGLLLTDAPEEQEALFKKIHRYFDAIAYKYLERRLKEEFAAEK